MCSLPDSSCNVKCSSFLLLLNACGRPVAFAGQEVPLRRTPPTVGGRPTCSEGDCKGEEVVGLWPGDLECNILVKP
eukprot:353304-Chlamydomonas_euryale.AAC.5